MLDQRLQQKLGLKFSPQQIQLMKLLQVPTANLEQRIKEEIEANPALEEGESADDEMPVSQEETPVESETPTETEGEGVDGDNLEDEEIKLDDEVDMSDYYDEDDEGVADYKTKDSSEYHDPDDDNKTIPVATSSSFHEYLESQVNLLDLDDRQEQIALHLIGSLDDDGYLRRELDAIIDDLTFRQGIACDEQELKYVLSQVQKLDPPGVGARNLEECLLIQLRRKEEPTIYTEIAIRVVEKYFDQFAKKHYEKLERAFDIDADKLKKVVDEITRLNPKPGSAFAGGGGEQYVIVPDFILTNTAGDLQVSLNSANAPELRISNHFKEMITTYKKSKEKSKQQKEAMLFIKQKIDSAKWFIEAIHSRYNTMMLTMQAILELQRDYLATGDETLMKPMILKDVAERTGLDISTISRVANSKYLQTEFGTIPLKFFFNEALTNDAGEEVSTREVKKILSDLIGMESKKKPISDQKLMEILNQRGYNIARRTVAKYREQLNIPVARLRKEL